VVIAKASSHCHFKMQILSIAKSFSYFLLAGLFEIGDGYLLWLWLREGKRP
jgi:hypothetical protein